MDDSPTPPPPPPDHPLDAIPALPPQWLAALKVRWITTAEQVLSIAHSPEGRAGLQASLPPNETSIDPLLELLAQAIGPAAAARALVPPSPSHPLGATLTDAQKKQFDVKDS